MWVHFRSDPVAYYFSHTHNFMKVKKDEAINRGISI